MDRIRFFKILCGIGFLVVLVSNIWTISGWSESRGVYDDVCYLRQAHLFERFGLRGINTDITFDDDHYLKDKLKAIGFAEWNDVKRTPCHTFIPVADKYVMQYPPGTGFALALFPSGIQVIPLYVLTSVVAVWFAFIALARASTFHLLMLVATFGDAAIYLMINPTKASYSMAPTMIVCALAGYLTARLFVAGTRHRLALTVLVGGLLGIAVNFRLPNLLLASGYGLFLLAAFLRARSRDTLLQGIAFAVAFSIGMAPTLIANLINAGSPFSTTYGGVDVAPPEINASVLWRYFADVQFILLVIAVLWTALILRFNRRSGARTAGLVVAGNLILNLLFFMTHPIFTPYYTVPVAMLSLWTLLFATLGENSQQGRATGLMEGPGGLRL